MSLARHQIRLLLGVIASIRKSFIRNNHILAERNMDFTCSIYSLLNKFRLLIFT